MSAAIPLGRPGVSRLDWPFSLSLTCATLPCPAKGGPAWTELTSDHFRLRTDLDADVAAEAIRTLEEIRVAMLALVWPSARVASQRIEVVVLRSSVELSTFLQGGRGRYSNSASSLSRDHRRRRDCGGGEPHHPQTRVGARVSMPARLPFASPFTHHFSHHFGVNGLGVQVTPPSCFQLLGTTRYGQKRLIL
jgi:hypothetical protein